MSRIARDLASSAHQHHKPNGNETDMQALRRSPGKVPNIAIVGAGVAGLRCADKLLKAGARVTVFEARDRVGGRLHQQWSGGHLMDMGPNWIHGTKGNPIKTLAEETNTSIIEPPEEDVIFDCDGKQKTNEESRDLSSRTWATIVDAFKYSDESSDSIDPKASLLDYYKERLSKDIKDQQHLRDALNESRMWGPFIGDPIDRQSLKFFFLEECIDGENVFVASTYRNILERIAKVALARNVIKFGTTISRVDYSKHPISVSTSDGAVETFDEVVITCPLGWLKQHHKQVFEPALPTRLQQAISNIGYGRLEKVYITFPSAFWLSESDPSAWPMFTHFHPPTGHSGAPPSAKLSDWNQSVVSLAHLPTPHDHPTLLFYIYGDCASRVVNSVKEMEPHTEEYNTKLAAYFEHFYSKLPNYSNRDPACKPVSYLATTWSVDDLAGNGSYCNMPVGLTQADKDIECMRDAGGLTERGVWLAGEHTAPFIALGTTTGAWWSGEAVARRIGRKYELKMLEENEQVGTNGQVKAVEHGMELPDAAKMNGLAL